MTHYLLAWNPSNFDWTDLDILIERVRTTGAAETWWSTATRHLDIGSRFYLSRVAGEPRGLIGSGTIISKPQETPHWDETRRAAGDTYYRIDIRFDALSRMPLIRRIELDHPPFVDQKWDPQASGISIAPEIASQLDHLWMARRDQKDPGTYHLPINAIERWRERAKDAATDNPWGEKHVIRDAQRRHILPAVSSLLRDFIEGRRDLAEFKQTFDKKTRAEWNVFGFAGLSGAGYINRLFKRLPAEKDLERELRAALDVPSSAEAARRQLDNFLDFLYATIRAGHASNAELHPGRALFLISVLWHVQRPDRWPPLYESARKALVRDGILAPHLFGGDGYLEFEAMFRAFESALSLKGWALEHLFARIGDEGSVEGGDGKKPGGDDDDEESESPRVWLYSPGPNASRWESDFTGGVAALDVTIGVGDLAEFDTSTDILAKLSALTGTSPTNDALACFEFSEVMQPGDIVFAKKGRTKIIGYGRITGAYEFHAELSAYQHVRKVDWKLKGEWTAREKPLVVKTLTNIGSYPTLLAQIHTALGLDSGTEADDVEAAALPMPYTLADARADLFVNDGWLTEQLELLRYRKNLVLQGPPGVGKTFLARRLAYWLLGERDRARVSQVQFHPSYSYEDFIQGYRPVKGGGFDRVDGRFINICDSALQDLKRPYVILIDEINRGNLGKIFGELLMLLEADKRDAQWAVNLAYAREDEPAFFIPPNVYVIGTMNTADRSLAMVDYALRRRFAFVDVPPAVHTEEFDASLVSMGVASPLRQRLISQIKHLNGVIENDPNLGDGFCIGHSYFCRRPADGEPDLAWYHRIIRTEIAPVLREYWFDDRERAETEIGILLREN